MSIHRFVHVRCDVCGRSDILDVPIDSDALCTTSSDIKPFTVLIHQEHCVGYTKNQQTIRTGDACPDCYRDIKKNIAKFLDHSLNRLGPNKMDIRANGEEKKAQPETAATGQKGHASQPEAADSEQEQATIEVTGANARNQARQGLGEWAKANDLADRGSDQPDIERGIRPPGGWKL